MRRVVPHGQRPARIYDDRVDEIGHPTWGGVGRCVSVTSDATAKQTIDLAANCDEYQLHNNIGANLWPIGTVAHHRGARLRIGGGVPDASLRAGDPEGRCRR